MSFCLSLPLFPSILPSTISLCCLLECVLSSLAVLQHRYYMPEQTYLQHLNHRPFLHSFIHSFISSLIPYFLPSFIHSFFAIVLKGTKTTVTDFIPRHGN